MNYFQQVTFSFCLYLSDFFISIVSELDQGPGDVFTGIPGILYLDYWARKPEKDMESGI